MFLKTDILYDFDMYNYYCYCNYCTSIIYIVITQYIERMSSIKRKCFSQLYNTFFIVLKQLIFRLMYSDNKLCNDLLNVIETYMLIIANIVT